MINRDNWNDIQSFLRYRTEVDFLSKGSLRFEESLLIHLLEWAQSTRLVFAPRIRPTFPEYVLRARRDERSKDILSSAYVHKEVATAKRFFAWAIRNKVAYRVIQVGWLETLKPAPMAGKPKDHQAVSLEYVRQIACSPVKSMREKRIRAAAVLWFLSGIRVGAFVTLPINAVDLEALEIRQWPSLGVKTKFKKHATTFLLNIPDLLEVVKAWDRFARNELGPDGLWFSAIDPETGLLKDVVNKNIGAERHTRARKDLKEWTSKLGEYPIILLTSSGTVTRFMHWKMP